MKVIEITNLVKHYGNVKAVNGISFSVHEGEIFGYLGPNGAGKTTTIECLMGFINPTSGNISIFGKDASLNSAELKQDIGYLSSDVHLYNNMTGKDHFDLVESIRGKSPILKQLVNDFSFDQKFKVHHLSTGNKQKLGIILSLMSQPKLLVLDEPTRGLDPLLQNIMYEHVLKLRNNGTTVFMSSHNLSEVDRLCDNVGIIKSGKLEAVETLETLKEKRIYDVRVKLEHLPEKNYFVGDGIQNVKELQNNTLLLRVNSNITFILEKLHNLKVIDLEITHASLEDIFMEFYK
jgi:ABC-2 type transport system ATP-binding protein